MSEQVSAHPTHSFPPEFASFAFSDDAFWVLVRRIVLLALLFVAEAVAISLWLDGEGLTHSAGLARVVGDWGAVVLRGVIGFAAIFATFALLKNQAALRQAYEAAAQVQVSWRFLAAHGCCLAVFAAFSSVLFATSSPGQRNDLIAAAWFVFGIAAVATAALAFLPLTSWWELLRRTGFLWAYAAASVVLASLAGSVATLLWRPASYATFGLAKLLLQPLVSTVVSDPARMVLGTPRFTAIISAECSGLEGAALVLAFGTLWLVLFRRECRFPQALLLLPAAVVLSFLLNVVRIAALILIGNAGARQVAARGFHSQAGWIFFDSVAVAFCLLIGRVPFFNRGHIAAESRDVAGENPTAAYLLPFLAILAAGVVSGAATANFEWLYPLRFFAAAGMLWAYRRSYRRLNWKCSGVGVAVGAIVFVVWIVMSRLTDPAVGQGIPADLIAASTLPRVTWIGFRIVASVITVPIAEELAFRGFLLRRLVAADFEAVPFERVSWWALLASSVIFGVLHGARWVPGIVAGLLFGLVLRHRGRMGDAVIAHALANALLAAYVLVFRDWSLW